MKQVQNLEFLIAFIYLACPIGLTGSACEIKCRFPAYGVLCQSACNCTKDQCNHISGCDGKWVFFYSSIDIHRCYIFMNKNKYSGRLVLPWSEWFFYVWIFVCCCRFCRIWRLHRCHWRHANFDLRSCLLNSEGYGWLDTPWATWGTCFQVALTFMKVVEHLSVELY